MGPDVPVLLAALLAGLVGSTHCAVMCGGIATGFSAMSSRPGWGSALQLNLGRVAGYALAGALVGAFGGGLLSLARHQNAVLAMRVGVGLALVVLLANLLGRWLSNHLGILRLDNRNPYLGTLVRRAVRTVFVLGGVLGMGLASVMIPVVSGASNGMIALPSTISSTDSTSTSTSTVPLVKPSVFNTASSGMRSRTACAMVLPVSSSRVKNTAAMIAVTIRPMSANCLAKDWLKACSVWLLVSRSEFSEIASMAFATRVA